MFVKWRLAIGLDMIDKEIYTTIWELSQRANSNALIVLGAGGGGLEPFLLREMRKLEFGDIVAVLTDLVPNPQSWREIQREFDFVSFVESSVDATKLPATLRGVRICTGMIHHLAPPLVKAFLEDAVRQGQPIIFLDGRPSFRDLLLQPPKSFALSYFSAFYFLWRAVVTRSSGLSGLVRELLRLLLTLTFVLPLIQAHDMAVSVLRFYGEADMRSIVEQVKDKDTFEWQFRYNDINFLTMLVGTPKAPKRAA